MDTALQERVTRVANILFGSALGILPILKLLFLLYYQGSFLCSHLHNFVWSGSVFGEPSRTIGILKEAMES